LGNDGTSLKIPNCILTGGKNWQAWSTRTAQALLQAGCWGAISTIPNPALAGYVVSDADMPTTGSVDSRVEGKAFSFLLAVVTDGLIGYITDAGTSARAWRALQNRYRQRATAQLSSLMMELYQLKKGPQESVEDYSKRAIDLRSNCRQAGSVIDEKLLLLQFLNGLPEAYQMQVALFKDHLDNGTEHTLDSVYQKLVERELNLHHAQKASAQLRMAHIADSHQQVLHEQQGFGGRVPGRVPGRGPGRGRGRGRRGPGRGQWAPTQPYNGGSGKKPVTCWNCQEAGHLSRDCPHPRKAPQAPQAKMGLTATATYFDPDTGQYHNESALVGVATAATDRPAAVATDRPLGRTDWIVDSGATAHITAHADLLVNYQPSDVRRVIRFGNGQVCHAAGIGDAFLLDMQGTVIRIRGVWHVPTACHNLVSVMRGVAGGFTFSINSTACRVFHRQQQVLHAEPLQGLWILKGAVPSPAVASRPRSGLQGSPVPRTDDSDQSPGYVLSAVHATLWHSRLAHLGYSNLLRMVQQNMVSGLPISATDVARLQGTDCDPCKLASLTRPPFPSTASRSTRPLQLVHTDLCGPLSDSITGEHYFLTALDDYSKLAVVAPLEKKSDTAEALKAILARLETATGHKTVAVRSDGGGEYISFELQAWLRQRGTQHQLTTAYTPQQNGAAERLNRTLLQKVRAVLCETAVSHDLWSEILCAVTHIRNLSPVSILDKTPHEAFYGRKPDVSHLRQLGCKAYTLIPKEKRISKLQPVSQAGQLVGYSTDRKAYRVLLDSSHTVVDTRDVSFVEQPSTGRRYIACIANYSNCCSTHHQAVSQHAGCIGLT
jgi:hypothetical protein